MSTPRPVQVAVLDLYQNEPNEGMRCILEILALKFKMEGVEIFVQRFDVRFLHQIPDLSFDIYISSGGPGSPLEEPGSHWEREYFGLMDSIRSHNAAKKSSPKFVFLICHSFQLMCRHWQLAEISKRRSMSFGIFPTHRTEAGWGEELLCDLPDPFYVVDSRDWQVTRPDEQAMIRFGARVLALEKERPHVDLERALMVIRFSPEIFGTQFHPEADPVGMLYYMLREDKKKNIIEQHGTSKFDDMLRSLNDAGKIRLTQRVVLPAFLKQAIDRLIEYDLLSGESPKPVRAPL